MRAPPPPASAPRWRHRAKTCRRRCTPAPLRRPQFCPKRSRYFDRGKESTPSSQAARARWASGRSKAMSSPLPSWAGTRRNTPPQATNGRSRPPQGGRASRSSPCRPIRAARRCALPLPKYRPPRAASFRPRAALRRKSAAANSSAPRCSFHSPATPRRRRPSAPPGGFSKTPLPARRAFRRRVCRDGWSSLPLRKSY